MLKMQMQQRGKDNNDFILYNINFIKKYNAIKLHFSVDDRFQTESVFLMI